MLKLVRLVAAVFALSSGAVAAQDFVGPNCGIIAFPIGGCVTPGPGSSEKTQVYTGLQISFGGASGPEPKLVLGARQTEATGDSVVGADLSVRISLKDGVKLDSSVLSAVGGTSDLLANAGVGYSYADKGWMAVGAVETPHLRVGADYVFTLGSPTYFVEINSIARHEAQRCGDGFYARDIDVTVPFSGGPNDFFVIDPALLDGKTTCVPENYPWPFN